MTYNFMTMHHNPGLFGIQHSNRNFQQAASWGKNIFNNAFPIALTSYMDARGIAPKYLMLNHEGRVSQRDISAVDVFGLSPRDPHIHYSFESAYAPYQTMALKGLPRADVVIQHHITGSSYVGLEIKLTALPDNTTVGLSDSLYGCEIVVRYDCLPCAVYRFQFCRR